MNAVMCLLSVPWRCVNLVPRLFLATRRSLSRLLARPLAALCHLTFSSFSHGDKDTSASVEELRMSAVKLLEANSSVKNDLTTTWETCFYASFRKRPCTFRSISWE